MKTEVTVVADSVNPFTGQRITTLQLMYPRFIHAEFMTHRVFSRSASSSRAIPVKTMLKRIMNNPAKPIHWGANKPGMQASRQVPKFQRWVAEKLWKTAAYSACGISYWMQKLGLHKQVANRITEPFQFISVVVTATDWDNWFELRNHKDAQPEIRYLAELMLEAMEESIPDERKFHLPYLTDEELAEVTSENILKVWAPVSAARCARTSYSNHDGSNPDVSRDLELYDILVGSRPLHASPTEHQAFLITRGRTLAFSMNEGGEDQCTYILHLPYSSKNFKGWTQFREYVESKTCEVEKGVPYKLYPEYDIEMKLRQMF